jgi:hypothetical protein
MQLRFLQTVTAVATEQNSTLVMPIPVELLNLFGVGRPAGDPGNGRAVEPPRPGPEDEPPPELGNGRPG